MIEEQLSFWGTKPDFSRVITSFQHQEPDRVPIVENTVSYEIMSQFLGKPVVDEDVVSQLEFWIRAGYDYIPLTIGMMRPGKVTQESQISKIIQENLAQDDHQDADESWNVWKRARILTENDIDTFPWEAATKLDLTKFQEVQAYLPADMKIILNTGKIFTITWMLMGFENFAVNIKLNPGFVTKVIEKVARIQLDVLLQAVLIPNVAAAWAVDDLAFGTGPMIRPADFRNFLFPWYDEFGKICRDNDLYFIFHSDGVMWDLIEDLIALGVNVLHPIDPTCMDIEEVKTKVKNRLSLIGNISNEILGNGMPEEVTELTKKRIRKLGPGGGYCLGSGNSVPDWAKIDNYHAMIETDFLYGRYPINI